MKLVFFGTPEFAATSLKAIYESEHEVLAVVTVPDRIGGRGNKIIESDVKKFAIEKGIPLMQPEKLRDPAFVDTLKALNADLFVVIAFRMLPEVVWSIPPMGTFNLHASLLPQLRGAAPINHAIIAGFKQTGVTTFFINHEIDKGEILLSDSTPIYDEDDAGTLHDRLMDIGARLVIKTIDQLASGDLHPSPQPQNDCFTPAPKIFKSDCKLDFDRQAKVVINQIRGLSPYPGSWAHLQLSDGKEIEVKILKGVPLYYHFEAPPGTCIVKDKKLLVVTSDEAVEITQIQPAGKKPMETKAFLAGYSPLKFF